MCFLVTICSGLIHVCKWIEVLKRSGFIKLQKVLYMCVSGLKSSVKAEFKLRHDVLYMCVSGLKSPWIINPFGNFVVLYMCVSGLKCRPSYRYFRRFVVLYMCVSGLKFCLYYNVLYYKKSYTCV